MTEQPLIISEANRDDHLKWLGKPIGILGLSEQRRNSLTNPGRHHKEDGTTYGSPLKRMVHFLCVTQEMLEGDQYPNIGKKTAQDIASKMGNKNQSFQLGALSKHDPNLARELLTIDDPAAIKQKLIDAGVIQVTANPPRLTEEDLARMNKSAKELAAAIAALSPERTQGQAAPIQFHAGRIFVLPQQQYDALFLDINELGLGDALTKKLRSPAIGTMPVTYILNLLTASQEELLSEDFPGIDAADIKTIHARIKQFCNEVGLPPYCLRETTEGREILFSQCRNLFSIDPHKFKEKLTKNGSVMIWTAAKIFAEAAKIELSAPNAAADFAKAAKTQEGEETLLPITFPIKMTEAGLDEMTRCFGNGLFNSPSIEQYLKRPKANHPPITCLLGLFCTSEKELNSDVFPNIDDTKITRIKGEIAKFSRAYPSPLPAKPSFIFPKTFRHITDPDQLRKTLIEGGWVEIITPLAKFTQRRHLERGRASYAGAAAGHFMANEPLRRAQSQNRIPSKRVQPKRGGGGQLSQRRAPGRNGPQ